MKDAERTTQTTAAANAGSQGHKEDIKMGKAMVVYKIYPEEETDPTDLMDQLNEIEDIKSAKKEPVAFGLEIVKAGALIDRDDDPDRVQEELEEKLTGYRNIEQGEATLIS